MTHPMTRRNMSPVSQWGPAPLALLSVNHPKRAPCMLLKQILRVGDRHLPTAPASELRSPSPSGGFSCLVFHVLSSTYTLVWAFRISVTLGVLLAILILALQYSCYPYYKDEEKGTAKWLIKADKKASVGAENRNQITWGFISGNVSPFLFLWIFV